MIVEKNGKTYIVRENLKSWTVKMGAGRVSVSYNVPKSDYATYDELKSYILESDLF